MRVSIGQKIFGIFALVLGIIELLFFGLVDLAWLFGIDNNNPLRFEDYLFMLYLIFIGIYQCEKAIQLIKNTAFDKTKILTSVSFYLFIFITLILDLDSSISTLSYALIPFVIDIFMFFKTRNIRKSVEEQSNNYSKYS